MILKNPNRISEPSINLLIGRHRFSKRMLKLETITICVSMMISIPSCGDNQIILMVKQAAIDLKYYCAKGGMWLRLGPNIPSTFTLYIKHFFWRNAYNKEFETYVGGLQTISNFLFF